MTDRDYYTEDEESYSEARYRNKEKRVGYVAVSNALIRLFADLPDAALRTYLALCSYAFGRGETFVGQETLCQIRGAHLSTIIKHIGALKEAGLISVERRGQGKTNIYIIEDIPEEALDDYIRLFIEKEDRPPQPVALDASSQKREVLTSQKRDIKTSPNHHVKTSPKRKTSKKVVERSIEEQQQHIPAAQPSFPSRSDSGNDTAVVAHRDTQTAHTAENTAARLAALGVAQSTIKSLLRTHEAALVSRWTAYTEHRLASGWVPHESPAAWVVSAIRSGDWVIPDWFQTPEEQARAAAQQVQLAEEERKRREEEAELERRRAEEQRRAVEAELGIGERTRETWGRVKTLLQQRKEFSVAFYGCHLLPLNGRVATIGTSVPFFSNVIERHSQVLRAVISEVSGTNIEALEVKLFQPATGGGEVDHAG